MWGREHLVQRQWLGWSGFLGGNFQNWVRLEIIGGASYVIQGKI